MDISSHHVTAHGLLPHIELALVDCYEFDGFFPRVFGDLEGEALNSIGELLSLSRVEHELGHLAKFNVEDVNQAALVKVVQAEDVLLLQCEESNLVAGNCDKTVGSQVPRGLVIHSFTRF